MGSFLLHIHAICAFKSFLESDDGHIFLISFEIHGYLYEGFHGVLQDVYLSRISHIDY